MVTAEMHSGFFALREELPFNVRARGQRVISPRCRADVERVLAIWSECRERYGSAGPWLFGERSIADVVYAPVALRFVSYDIATPGRGTEFVAAVEADPHVQTWVARARRESEALPAVDELAGKR